MGVRLEVEGETVKCEVKGLLLRAAAAANDAKATDTLGSCTVLVLALIFLLLLLTTFIQIYCLSSLLRRVGIQL